MTVFDIYYHIDQIAPFNLTMDFDNTGLLVGDFSAEVSSVVLALDCTSDVINFALQNNANLIITHHPVIFNPIKKVCADSIVYQLIRHNINVISAHTNLDITKGGVNDCLARKLDLNDISGLTVLSPSDFKDNSIVSRETLGRIGSLSSPMSARDFADFIKSKLNGTSIRYTNGGKLISKVAVCGGSGDSELHSAMALGADALVTGEVKHHLFVEASNSNFSLFEAGHFFTEDVVLDSLADSLSQQFKDISFSVYHDSFVLNA